jgi:hypothetical protein
MPGKAKAITEGAPRKSQSPATKMGKKMIPIPTPLAGPPNARVTSAKNRTAPDAKEVKSPTVRTTMEKTKTTIPST